MVNIEPFQLQMRQKIIENKSHMNIILFFLILECCGNALLEVSDGIYSYKGLIEPKTLDIIIE